ncbi:MAG: hypothetical protein A2804_00570 [Candidatus Pacebacteria bacterium RIFCSPHIGHO2_01_FULL_46_10]|nr:MAG: hypothetical protein A2804_00570 [Candidatus Pacebacteria bacterium RIFCSPHIGHO2_01_FULL_46_10]
MQHNTYPYFHLQENIYKPWIEVRLGSPLTHKVLPHPVVALIDSGADVCFCSDALASYLGVASTKKNVKKEKFTAANNQIFTAYKINLRLYACGREYICPFFICSELPHETPIILGQKGFFTNHKILFDFPNKLMEIDTL